MQQRHVSLTSVAVALLLGLFAVVFLVASLGWEYRRDTPLLNYVGFLIWEHGYAPYRDIFETSMPGTLAFHALVSGFGLTGNLEFILLAILIVTSFAVLGALAILPFGSAGALIAAPLIICTMFVMGPGWILKIDMVALLPISAALCLAIWQVPRSGLFRQFLIGALFGVAGTMKPHLMLGAPVVVLAAYATEHWTGRWGDLPVRRLFAEISVSLAGFAVPMVATGFWLLSVGSWERFIFVLTEYLPLHLEKTDWHEFVSPEEKRRHTIVMTLRVGGNYPLVPMAGLAPLLALIYRRSLSARQIILLVALCLLAAIYGLAPGLGGQFYIYYYFPFLFFSLLLIASSFSLVERTAWHWGIKSLWILSVTGFLAVYDERHFRAGALFSQSEMVRVSQLEEALVKWVPEGGRVQPIDWTAGVVHAMLRQKVLPATPYLYDYHFHHHVGSRINSDLRSAFISALEDDPPEVFLELKEFSRVSGLNTSDRFPARDAFLAERYQLVEETGVFRVHVRNDLVGSVPSAKAGG